VLLGGLIEQGATRLFVGDALRQQQAVKASRPLLGIKPLHQYTAVVEQLQFLPFAVQIDPFLDHRPRFTHAPAIENQAMLVPQMRDHLRPAQLRPTARTIHAQPIFQLFAQRINGQTFAGVLFQAAQSFD
jgi:hypothetical protein